MMENNIYKPKDIAKIVSQSSNRKIRNIKGIIALTGKSDIGKSSTLHELIDLLCPGFVKSFPKDVRVSFRYNGNLILVCTAGDDRKFVEENCQLAEAIQPDVFVTAVNYHDGATRAFDYYAEEMKEYSFVQLKISKGDLNSKSKGTIVQQNAFAANELKTIIDAII